MSKRGRPNLAEALSADVNHMLERMLELNRQVGGTSSATVKGMYSVWILPKTRISRLLVGPLDTDARPAPAAVLEQDARRRHPAIQPPARNLS
jgi:hypothetical protein